MQIVQRNEENRTFFDIVGRIDTNTSPELQKVTEECCNSKGFSMVLNFADVEFISSAGLRVLLLIQKKANAMSGVFTLQNVSETIQEVFQMTGFSDILAVE
ncbi:STAS domain-containing protein [Eubacteriaceae bacterium ES2]|nr:STAS domain-containing protein [Eubacteriaceae bacterium ES2]